MPKNSKVDKLELEKRLRIVQEWIIEDWPYQDIISQIVFKSPWNVEERQAKRYVAEARRRWVSQHSELTEHKRRLKIESLRKLKRSLLDRFKGTPHGIRAVLSVEKEIIKLENLNPVKKVELTGKDGKPLQTEATVITNVDYTQIPTDALKAIVAARIKPSV